MKKLSFALAGLVFLMPSTAQAQVRLSINLGLPVAPPLVQVQPGIQVVEGFGEEVFFSAGWYWCRRPDGWYRAASPRAPFGWVDARRVPSALVRMPAGRYRIGDGLCHRRASRAEAALLQPDRSLAVPGQHGGGTGAVIL